jgi:hypothetical protein
MSPHKFEIRLFLVWEGSAESDGWRCVIISEKNFCSSVEKSGLGGRDWRVVLWDCDR